MDGRQEYLRLSEALPASGLEDTEAGLARFVSALRTRLFEIYVLLVSVLVWTWILFYVRWTRKPRQVRAVLRFWSRSFIGGARAILGVRYRIEGWDNVPAGPVIFVGNHQSYWESIAMTAIVPDLNVVTKRAAMAIPVFGWGLRYAPMTPVDRDAPGRNIRRMVRQARTSLAEGRSMLIFPEGGRVPPRQRRPFARGLEILYRECGATVVPFVTDAGLCWPSGFAPKRAGTITLRFLPPVAPGRDPRAFVAEIERLLNEEKDRLAAAAG